MDLQQQKLTIEERLALSQSVDSSTLKNRLYSVNPGARRGHSPQPLFTPMQSQPIPLNGNTAKQRLNQTSSRSTPLSTTPSSFTVVPKDQTVSLRRSFSPTPQAPTPATFQAPSRLPPMNKEQQTIREDKATDRTQENQIRQYSFHHVKPAGTITHTSTLHNYRLIHFIHSRPSRLSDFYLLFTSIVLTSTVLCSSFTSKPQLFLSPTHTFSLPSFYASLPIHSSSFLEKYSKLERQITKIVQSAAIDHFKSVGIVDRKEEVRDIMEFIEPQDLPVSSNTANLFTPTPSNQSLQTHPFSPKPTLTPPPEPLSQQTQHSSDSSVAPPAPVSDESQFAMMTLRVKESKRVAQFIRTIDYLLITTRLQILSRLSLELMTQISERDGRKKRRIPLPTKQTKNNSEDFENDRNPEILDPQIDEEPESARNVLFVPSPPECTNVKAWEMNQRQRRAMTTQEEPEIQPKRRKSKGGASSTDLLASPSELTFTAPTISPATPPNRPKLSETTHLEVQTDENDNTSTGPIELRAVSITKDMLDQYFSPDSPSFEFNEPLSASPSTQKSNAFTTDPSMSLILEPRDFRSQLPPLFHSPLLFQPDENTSNKITHQLTICVENDFSSYEAALENYFTQFMFDVLTFDNLTESPLFSDYLRTLQANSQTSLKKVGGTGMGQLLKEVMKTKQKQKDSLEEMEEQRQAKLKGIPYEPSKKKKKKDQSKSESDVISVFEPLSVTLRHSLDNDEEFDGVRKEALGIVNASFSSLVQYSFGFLPFLKFHLFNLKFAEKNFVAEDHTAEWYSSHLDRLSAELSDISNIPDSTQIGVFLLEFQTIKLEMQKKCEKCSKNISISLPVIATHKRETLASRIRAKIQTVITKPTDIEDYAVYVKEIQRIQNEQSDERIQLNVIESYYQTMREHNIEIAGADQANLQLMEKSMSQLQSGLIVAEGSLEEQKRDFTEELKQNIEELKNRIMQTATQLDDSKFLSNPQDVDATLSDLKQLSTTVGDLEEEAKRTHRYQKLFALQPEPFEKLEPARQTLNQKTTLWKTLYDWNTKQFGWKHSSLKDLNRDGIFTDYTSTLKQCTILERQLPENQVLHALRSDLTEFGTLMPILDSLLNPNLKEHHWTKIWLLLTGSPEQSEEGDSFGWLLEHNVKAKAQLLATISDEATQEAVLSEMLKKIQADWESMELHMREFKNDTYLLVEVDELLREYDDAFVQLSTIRGSRSISKIKTEVESLNNQFNTFNDVINLWIQLQKKWVYLEPVFESEDLLKDHAKSFSDTDRFWRDLMNKARMTPKVTQSTQQPGLSAQLKNHNAALDKIQLALDGLLNEKRNAFARFFFLPNDDLLEILKEGKNPLKVMPHMNKLFDNIKTLDFSNKDNLRRMEIVGMISSENEIVAFGEEKVNPRSKPVEAWMKNVEMSMEKTIHSELFNSMHSLLKLNPVSAKTLDKQAYGNWIRSTKAQVVIAASQIHWTMQVESVLRNERVNLEMTKQMKKMGDVLDALTELVRFDLSPLERTSVGALIVIQVHARDIVEELQTSAISSLSDFEWQKRLRYYWDPLQDECVIRQTKSSFRYGCEYLGCTPRLVITPLTDQCYITLTSALHLKMGGAPAGPAGTGKTETTKDLAKAVARQCVVFNCSDGLNVETMEQMFSGMCQAGAWFCFDEFNRIDIEVLSVVAQQIREIQDAQQANQKTFIFQGNQIPLNTNCAVFITMNPGYAGRTELPDNLKALFRPVSMMIPDYALIAEIMLYSEGFKTAKPLSIKMTQLYKLSSEQLSQQSHYDFGMRAVKSVLVMAGQLRRSNPNLEEDIVLIRAMKESNIPKFLADDVPLFNAIVGDLFPSAEVPENDVGELTMMLQQVLEERHFQVIPTQLHKTVELFDTFGVRHGVMLVGPTQGGKTVIRDTLAEALTRLRTEIESADDRFQIVEQSEMNPKSITVDDMFGSFNQLTQEWKEGLLSFFVQNVVLDDSAKKKWIIFDGPVDTLWVESLNTVLDDSKTLCLPNRKRIKLTNTVSLLFEVADLKQASPATVSRCGMVYVDDSYLSWGSVVSRWLNKLDTQLWPEWLREKTQVVFEEALPPILERIRDEFVPDIPQPMIAQVQNVLRIIDAILTKENGFNPEDQNPDEEDDGGHRKGGMSGNAKGGKQNVDWAAWVHSVIFYAVLWGIGGNLKEKDWPQFDIILRDSFGQVFIPVDDSSFGVGIDIKGRFLCRLDVPEYVHNSELQFNSILVPTIDTVRYGFLVKLMIDAKVPVLVTGETGVGKTVIVNDVIAQAQPASDEIGKHSIQSIPIGFSAQTSSHRTQLMIEQKLQNRRDHFSAPPNTTVVLVLDDFNLPAPDQYGSQPPLELIRQLLGKGGWYDRNELEFRAIKDTTVVAVCGPPGGGRNQISPRLTSQFVQLRVPQPSDATLFSIFNQILDGFVTKLGFPTNIKDIVGPIVRTSIELYNFALNELKPTPSRSHYLFNLRDLSKVFQGLMSVAPDAVEEDQAFQRLWAHEEHRVFADRLIDTQDRLIFTEKLCSLAKTPLRVSWTPEMFSNRTLPLWVDFQSLGEEPPRPYVEVKSEEKLGNLLETALEEFNMHRITKKQKQIDLVFFKDAIDHIARITRVLRQERGNALLVGVGGCGKQSLTRIAAYLSNCACFEISLTSRYGQAEFRDDLKKLYTLSGAEGKPTVFLLSDNQIVNESFLEDINCILNSGDVPGLFDIAERELLLQTLRDNAKTGEHIPENPDQAMQHLILRVRNNLHIVLCMSPIGDAFRVRCRMFPSLVNCCTIDWVDNWPNEALYSVALKFFSSEHLGSDPAERMKEKKVDESEEVKNEAKSAPNSETVSKSKLPAGVKSLAERIAEMCVFIHDSVERAADRFFVDEKRRVYITPALFLEMVGLFFSIFQNATAHHEEEVKKYSNGITTLVETQKSVDSMKAELKQMEPLLIKLSDDLKTLVTKIATDTAKTEELKYSVGAEETMVREEAEKAKGLADDAQAELDKIMPVFEEANRALESLSKAAVTEVKSFANPPEMVKRVMSAVCTLFNKKPDWDNARGLLSQTNFIQLLINFNVDEIDASMDKKMRPYINDPDFKPDKIENVSKAAANICQWVVAVVEFARVNKIIEPKKQIAAEAQATLKGLTEKLEVKMNELKQLEDALQDLNNQLATKKKEASQTEADLSQTRTRFQNAEKLVSALGDEGERWREKLGELNNNSIFLQGSSLLSAATLAYLGPFSADFRRQITLEWTDRCRSLLLPSVAEGKCFELQSALSSEVETRDWAIQGLPSDKLSLDNAVVVTRSRKWPLMVDPQGQANRWIRAKENNNKLKVMRIGEPSFIRNLSNSIRFGQPVLLEDVGEQLDPQLEPILNQQIIKQAGRTIIHLNDQDVDYNSNFKLYITTKLPNPKYLPEMFIKTTVINFTVTSMGLEEQLLAEVVLNEKKEIEDAKDKLVRGMAADKRQLVEMEARILQLMKSKTVTELLDDTSLIATLDQSKRTSIEINTRVKEAIVTEASLMAARAEYNPMAVRGALLYFSIVDLASLDPMYQYSLRYFQSIFKLALTQTEQKPTLEERLNSLIENLTEMVSSNVCRGLFERHRIIFSLLMTMRIKVRDGTIKQSELDVLLKSPDVLDGSDRVEFEKRMKEKETQEGEQQSPPQVDPSTIHNPSIETISGKSWSETQMLDHNWPTVFGGICASIAQKDLETEALIWDPILNSTLPLQSMLPEPFLSRLSPFQFLILVKTLVPQKLSPSISFYVRNQLGEVFAESPPLDLKQALADSSPGTPIIFILSTGADPAAHLLRHAQNVNYTDKLKLLSLGQGQGPAALKLIRDGMKNGSWVFLQNCHLAASWMPDLERVCLQLQLSSSDSINPSFRLWLSAMPTPAFPVSVLQNGIKLTTEAPAGVRANLLRTIRSLSDQEYQNGCAGKVNFAWRRLVVGLAFFHAIVQERRRFGALGWNIPYEFTESDFEISKSHLKLYLNEKKDDEEIPWAALRYLTGEVNYGGRVTDEWDKRILSALLIRFYVDRIVVPGKSFVLMRESKPRMKDLRRQSGLFTQSPYSPSSLRSPPSFPSPQFQSPLLMPFSPTARTPNTQSQSSSSSSSYILPPDLPTLASVLELVEGLPLQDEPELFGMNENVERLYQMNEGARMLGALLTMNRNVGTVKPKQELASESAESEENDDFVATSPGDVVVMGQVKALLKGLPELLPVRAKQKPVQPSHEASATVLPLSHSLTSLAPSLSQHPPTQPLSSLQVVLSQETERFNNLLTVMSSSLIELNKAMRGLAVMSSQLDALYSSILTSSVPSMWASAAYISNRSLGDWIDDLRARVDFFRKWIENGEPDVFWLPGLFFQQGFLTAILQTMARKHKYPIDSLSFEFSFYTTLDEAKMGYAEKLRGAEARDPQSSFEETIGSREGGLTLKGLDVKEVEMEGVLVSESKKDHSIYRMRVRPVNRDALRDVTPLFLRTEPANINQVAEASQPFLSLVNFIKKGKNLNEKACRHACSLLKTIAPRNSIFLSATQILFELVPKPNGSCCVALACTDLLIFFETDGLAFTFLLSVVDGRRQWTRDGPAVRKRGHQIMDKLQEEGSGPANLNILSGEINILWSYFRAKSPIFLRTNPYTITTIEQASQVFLSLSGFIKEGNHLSKKASRQACTLLEEIARIFSADQIIIQLSPTSDGSCSVAEKASYCSRFDMFETGLFQILPQSFYEQEIHILARPKLRRIEDPTISQRGNW
ncbi:putative Dynein axonemal heavy chain 6 [Blattamonas nauphoetae]|uniref:Dynein axonemal heavy chain 6 n=1 Tax=Blattamonas nauphoetae TaxID=2049346 RepID=A0ABQ9XMK0_9EUKA|nr:putative Dynein axonemal heavy chain 6 [Blattamonas nauphoetae]